MSTRLLHGDCREVLKTLPSESVHCVVTSPPYFGLRDYGTGQWEGGDPTCLHQGTVARSVSGGDGKQYTNAGSNRVFSGDCLCGARRTDSQIGLEATPDAYVAELVAVFREVRRVLRNDGTLWLNLGDSYSSGGRTTQVAPTLRGNGKDEASGKQAYLNNFAVRPGNIAGLKPKDLIGIPWMVAFALRADGWYLRQDIIWSKPNPMPESVRDRCTKAHEYIFLLSKGPRYFYDAEAIAEPTNWPEGSWGRSKCYDGDDTGKLRSFYGNGSQWKGGETRNKRSVWEVATQPFSEAHFATFPPALIEPCILAGCPAKACAACGKPWVREVESGELRGRTLNDGDGYILPKAQAAEGDARVKGRSEGWTPNHSRPKTTLGFSPSCSCNAATVPGTCLDPFAGAGTTGLVADRLGRNAILIELNAGYADMSHRRIVDDAPLFAEVVA